jgi:hypothetical protein
MWDNAIARGNSNSKSIAGTNGETVGEGEVDMLRRDWERTFEKWVWAGDDRDIRGVWVRGRKVV